MSAYFASDIINQSGAGMFNQSELDKIIAGKAVKLKTNISTLYESVQGACSPNSFETLLKLNYLHFTHHKVDSNVFNNHISELEYRAENLWFDPWYVFYDTIVKTATLNHPRELTVPTKKQIRQIKYKQVEEVFRERFSDAGDFTFFIVGNFETDTLIPYLEKYLGGLPSKNKPETWQDVEPEFPSTSKYLYVYKGTEPHSKVAILMKGDFNWYNDRLKFDVLNKMLEIRLKESLREEDGKVHYLAVDGNYSRYPDPGYSLYLSFDCDPGVADSLAYAVISEMREIIINGPNEKILNEVKKSILKDRETNNLKNTYWITNLQRLYFYDEPILKERKFKRFLKKIKHEDIQKVASKYYQVNHFVMGILYPENVELKR
jgi:zinc protease